MHADVAEVRMLLGSPDARVRALAARSACPCHGTFELLHALKDELTLLAETDPDKNVRSAAGHVLREAIELNVAEEAKLSRERDREVRQERRDRKRAARSDAALRRARRRGN
jgi:HEAT repeat protein